MIECPYNYSCHQCTKPYIQKEDDEPFSFKFEYSPIECLWGKYSSKILYVGVNPFSERIGGNNHFSSEILRNGPSKNSYFGTIHHWYPPLYEEIGKENGVAFTDLIKCYSPTFPFKRMKVSDYDIVFRNCRIHLDQQIRQMARQNLKLVIVSGIHPCWHLLDMYFNEQNNSDKSIDCIGKETTIEDNIIHFAFFRKFMGRKDVSKQYREEATSLLKKLID